MGLRSIALIYLIGGAFAGTIPRNKIDKCSTECHPPQNPKFFWQMEKSYVYSFKLENRVIYAGNEKQTSFIVGKVELQGIDSCNIILRMKNVTVNEKMSEDEVENFKEKLKLPVVISHNDLELKNVCPSAEESTQSLNIKRAIIASMINTMSKLDSPQEVEEYDTLGKCHTKYTIEKGRDLVIKKEKDLKTCTNRHEFISDFIKKKIPSTFLFEKEYVECKQYIEDKLMKKSTCKEIGKMKMPLKDQNNLIEFSGMLEINLVEITQGETFHHQITTREEILLNLEESRPGDSSDKKVENILLDLCLKNMEVIDININSDFMKLISHTKVLSYKELKRIYESLKSGKLCIAKKVKDVFVDTLPVIGTDAAVKLIAKLIENEEVTGLKAKLLPASFALIQKPTKDTVAAVADLVENHPSASVIFGVTALIHRLCSSENCGKISSVSKVVTAFNDYLGPECNSGDEKKVLTALKAFGNMGYHGEAYRNIIECAKSCSKPKKIRLAAIEAFRRIDMKRPDEFLQIFSKNEDYEIRIAVFASLMKQADEQQLQQLAEIAENETDEQVSNYIYTYFKNMEKTSLPSKQKIRQMLQKLKIRQPNHSYWENSKNIEISGFSKLMAIGAAIETDIIQDPNTKIPRSVHTRLDVDVFNKSFNLLELGIRTEKLEEIVNKLVGLKQEFSKTKMWNYFRTKNLLGDTNAELSFFVRAMNTELLDLSTSDLLALRDVVNIAEMARGKDFDLSHSFVFMNSKLVLPSITGRSYAIDLTGSSTVGLTARSKIDLLSFPENGNVQLQFQPSMNVEISTSIGIQSNHYEPDIKIASHLNVESNIEASFEVKDGHFVLAKLTLPSDDIMVVKMSNEMLRINGNNSAKSVFSEMQKKINHCFSKLEKPLGISACAVVEVPKPLVVRTFPYIFPFGNVELALKKSDIFRSYEIQLGAQKNSGKILKYKASLDTPGSRIKRRFAADFEVIQQNDSKKFIVELTSPFKSMGGSGSYTWSRNLHQGILEFHTDSAQVFSANFTNNIISSKGMKSYESSSSVSYRGNDSTYIDGVITITKGRKCHLNFDFTANKPHSRPFRLKGSFTKEGKPSLAFKSEWKLSSDVSLNSPFGDLHLSQITAKVSKRVQAVSGNLRIDYQIKGMEKQTIAFSGETQTNSGKMDAKANFEVSQYPEANWHLNWDMQLTEGFKTDILLKCGRYPEKNYVHLKLNSSIPNSGHGRCTAVLEIPSLNVNFDATIKYDLDFSERSKMHVDADIYYADNKHLKGLVDVKYQSKHPLKANGKIEVKFPGGHYIYEETIAETGSDVIEGNSKLHYGEDKVIELTYKIKTLHNDSIIYCEIESSFQSPSSPNPMKNKALLQINSDNLILTGDLNSYSLQANFKKAGVTQINLKSSKSEGKVEVVNEMYKKSISLDLKFNSKRHVKASIIAEFGAKKRFHLEIIPSFENEPEKKILISSDIDIIKINDSGDNNKGASNLLASNQREIFKPFDVSYNGSQEFHLMSSIKNFPLISLSCRTELNEGLPKFALNFSRNLIEKAKIELGGRLLQNDKKQEFSFKTLALSPDNSFENLALTLNHKISHHESSTMMESFVSFKKKAKLYKAEWNSDLQPHKLEMKAKMLTPFTNFKKQSIGIFLKQNDNGISSSINIETPDNKLVSLVTDVRKNVDGYSVVSTLNSPFDIVKDVQAQLTIESHSIETQIDAYIDVNNARLSELQSSISVSSEETKLEGSLRLIRLPNIEFEGLHIIYKHEKTFMSVSGKIDLVDCKDITFNSEIKNENGTMTSDATIMTPYESLKDANVQISAKRQSTNDILLCFIDANGKQILDVEIKILASSVSKEIQSRIKTIHMSEKLAYFKSDRMGESFSVSIQVWNGTSSNSTTNELPNVNGELTQTKDLQNKLFDFKISKEVSKNNFQIYGLKASGMFPLVSVTFSIHRNERSSHSSELRLCQETRHINCYSIKSNYKNMVNSRKYRFYKNLSIELKTFIDSPYEKSLGGLNLLLSANKHDFRSKIIFNLKEKAAGYDITVHTRQHENDRHSIDCKLNHPLRDCRVASSILHNSNRTLFEIESTRDVDPPGRLFLIAIGREINHKTKEVSIFIKMTHPNMSEPLLLSSEFQKVEGSFRSVLKISHNATTENALIAEIIPNVEHGSSGSLSKTFLRRSLLFKLYTKDKTLDMSLMLTKQRSEKEDKVGYEWDLNLPTTHKKGGIVVTLSRKSKNIRIIYLIPSTNSEIPRQMEDENLSLISHWQKSKEISIKASGSCLDVDVLSSGPIIRSSFCFNKRRGNFLHLIKGEIYHRRHKSVDALIDLDLRNPTFIDVSVKWKKQELCKALEELSGRIFNECSIAEIKELLKGQLEFYKKDILEPTLKDLWNEGKHYTENKYKTFKNAVTVHSVVLDHDIKVFNNAKSKTALLIQSLKDWKHNGEQLVIPIIQALKCSVQKDVQNLLKYLPDFLGIACRSISSRLQNCMEKFCSEGTFCHRFIQPSYSYGLKNIKNILNRKFSYSKKSVGMRISKPHFNEAVSRIKNDIDILMQKTGTSTLLTHELLLRISKAMKKIIPQKTINATDQIIKKINNKLSQDEDFNSAKDLILEAFKQLKKSWGDKIRQIQNAIKENPEKMIQEQFQNLTYNPQEGELHFRIRQPFKAEKIENMGEEMRKVVQVLQRSLDI